jgi:hypothetical protein
MDHIVVRIQPFIYLQQIEVYKDGKCIDISKSNMINLDENISIKAKVHNIKNIDLAGDKNFTQKIKERLTQNKFNLDLDIKLY